VHPDGNEAVGAGDGLADLLGLEPKGIERDRVKHDVILGHAPADQRNPRDAANAQEARLNLVAGHLPQISDGPRLARQTDADDRERGEGEPK